MSVRVLERNYENLPFRWSLRAANERILILDSIRSDPIRYGLVRLIYAGLSLAECPIRQDLELELGLGLGERQILYRTSDTQRCSLYLGGRRTGGKAVVPVRAHHFSTVACMFSHREFFANKQVCAVAVVLGTSLHYTPSCHYSHKCYSSYWTSKVHPLLSTLSLHMCLLFSFHVRSWICTNEVRLLDVWYSQNCQLAC